MNANNRPKNKILSDEQELMLVKILKNGNMKQQHIAKALGIRASVIFWIVKKYRLNEKK